MAKAVPEGVHTWDFSYARRIGKFRWRLDGDEWLCDSIAGKVYVDGVNTATGHLTMTCRLILDDDNTAYVYRE